MGGYFTDAGAFLIETLFGLYILAVLLRFLLQLVRADFYNPIAQFLVVLTNPPLKPLRRLIPGLYGIDFASVALLLLLELLYQWLLTLLLGQALPAGVLLVKGVFHLLNLVLSVYLFSILIVVVLSWINPYPNALSQMLGRLTGPLLRPARRWLPPLGGLDLSPMLVMIGIVLVQMALPYLQRAAFDLVR
jgi:YggT family protein